MSICQRNKSNYENDDSQDGPYKPPSRTKKNKTRMPQNEISDEDDEEDDDIPITKHISLTNDQVELKNNDIFESISKEKPEIIEKIKKAKKNWIHLKEKLIQKRIDILREMVKKEKAENESDEEEDEKIEDIMKDKSYDKNENITKTYNQKLNNIFESQKKEGDNNYSIEEDKEEDNV